MKAALCKLADIPAAGATRVDFFGREALDAASGDVRSGPAGTCQHALMLPTRVEDGVLNYVWGE